MAMKKRKTKKYAGPERRKTERLPILETFLFFVVVPKKGLFRLPAHDISEGGILFDLDTDEEEAKRFPVESGEDLDIQFYINQSLYLSLSVRVMRILKGKGPVRQIGAEFRDVSEAGYMALKAFLEMVDKLTPIAKVKK